MEQTKCADFSDAFWRLLFDAYDGAERCTDVHGVCAFATLAALSFAAFVVVDLMVFVVRRFGFAAAGAGSLTIERDGTWWGITLKTLAIVLFGMLAAWIVAFFAAIVEFLQLAPQTAVATGVLWQVTYAQLLARFGRDQEASPFTAQGAPPLPPPADIQQPTEEVAE
jgi:hypothetical protein